MKAILSIVLGSVALAVGFVCHKYAPGLGLVLMPMFWPLALLAALVPARYSVTTAVLVPFASCLLTGMPAWPFVVAVKFALLALGVSYLTRRIYLRRK